jgi:predicted heme/steroid binding protein
MAKVARETVQRAGVVMDKLLGHAGPQCVSGIDDVLLLHDVAGKPDRARMRRRRLRYTSRELTRHDGSDPTQPVLIAYEGRVYDVTASLPWHQGSHWEGHRAGQDLTGRIRESIHVKELLARVRCVGVPDE